MGAEQGIAVTLQTKFSCRMFLSIFSAEFNTMEWIVIPLLIFCARIIDVSISTLRMMYTINEKREMAVTLGFFEVLIWLIAVGQALQHLSTPFAYIGYAGGFATGTYVGMFIEKKLATGIVLMRIITVKSDSQRLTEYLRRKNYLVTVVDAENNEGNVNVVFLPAKRKDLPQLEEIIRTYNPNAFYSIENLRYVSSLKAQLGGLAK